MSAFSYDEMVAQLVAMNVPRARAEAVARQRCGLATPDPAAMRDRDEDAHVAEGVKLMRALGFEHVSFSQKKRAKVTPGIPDHRFYHRGRRLALWWEAKSATGRQRPDQTAFQEMCEACGETYVLGELQALQAWLVAAGVAEWDGPQLVPRLLAVTSTA